MHPFAAVHCPVAFEVYSQQVSADAKPANSKPSAKKIKE